MDITTLLRALQFGDSFLPVGSFSFSNGLESAIQQGIVHDVTTLTGYIRVALDQSASADGIALLQAYRAAAASDLARILQCDRALFNRKLNQEMRSMSVRMGRKLGELAQHVSPTLLLEQWLTHIKQAQTPGTYPIGLALIAVEMNLAPGDAFALHQYGVAMMMTGAALRLMKITHMETQSILFELNREAQAAYEHIAEATLDDMTAFAPFMDILAAHHVKANVRMFMN